MLRELEDPLFATRVAFSTSGRQKVKFPSALLLNCLAAAVLLCGCLSVSAQTPDRSWRVSEYVRLGMPDPGRFWMASDYVTCCNFLRQLDRTNRAAFPRLDSPRSGPVFARLINATNTLHCLEAALPAPERLKLYQNLIIFLPSILDMYKLSGSDATFHRETVELSHTHLHLLRLAIELDGKPMPGTPEDSRSPRFHLREATLTPWNAPYGDPNNYMVPRNGSFGVLGAHAAVTLGRLLPWLGDRTVVPDSERLAATRYLSEDVPLLWTHIVPASRKGLLQDLEAVIEGTRQVEVRQGLENLKKQLTLIKEGS